MLNFIKSQQDYTDAITEFKQVFRLGVDIVDNSFAEQFIIYEAFEFDRIYSEEFYRGLQHFLNNRNSKGFTFFTLIPDAEHYFFAHFSKYSITKVASDVPYNEYIEFLHTDPGNSPADALINNAETIAIYSDEPTWGIIGSKDLEIGIVGFKDENTKSQFISYFDNNTFIDIKTRLDELNEMLKLQPDTKAIHTQLIRNYSR